jgi:hypothetical protein
VGRGQPAAAGPPLQRAAKLFVAVLVTSVVGIPRALWELGLRTAESGSQERQKQEQLRRQLIDLEKAARRGETGEATRRLFGASTPPTARPRPPKDGAGAGGAKEGQGAGPGAAAGRARE